MGQNQSKGAVAYSRPLIQGLPDALPNFEIKLNKPQETQALAFPALDWECLDKPLHINGKVYNSRLGGCTPVCIDNVHVVHVWDEIAAWDWANSSSHSSHTGDAAEPHCWPQGLEATV